MILLTERALRVPLSGSQVLLPTCLKIRYNPQAPTQALLIGWAQDADGEKSLLARLPVTAQLSVFLA